MCFRGGQKKRLKKVAGEQKAQNDEKGKREKVTWGGQGPCLWGMGQTKRASSPSPNEKFRPAVWKSRWLRSPQQAGGEGSSGPKVNQKKKKKAVKGTTLGGRPRNLVFDFKIARKRRGILGSEPQNALCGSKSGDRVKNPI